MKIHKFLAITTLVILILNILSGIMYEIKALNIQNDTEENIETNRLEDEVLNEVENNTAEDKISNEVINDIDGTTNETENSEINNTTEDNIVKEDQVKETEKIEEEIIQENSIMLLSEDSEELGVTYRTHVQNIGWQNYVKDGETSGTSGKSYRLEGINIKLQGSYSNLKIKYQVHVENIGWQGWKTNGEMAGTEGKSYRLEGIKILLESTDDYSVMYRVHVQNIGWQDWKTDGEMAGTEGKSLRLEAIQIKIVPKVKKGIITLDTAINGSTYYSPTSIKVIGWKMSNVSNTKIKAYIDGSSTPIEDNLITYKKRNDVLAAIVGYGTEIENPNPGFEFSINTTNMESGPHTIRIVLFTSNDEKIQEITTKINIDRNLHVQYKSHVQNVGWQGYVMDGEMSGTSGKSYRIEAMNISLINAPSNAKIIYRTHVQNVGWQSWKSNGEMTGTSGRSLRIEAIEIKLENMDDYTVEYQVHIQDKGWSSWYIDGETAGTVGQAKRIEAIRIRIVSKYKRQYHGIDVSKWQGNINYDKLINTGKVDFMIARAGWYSESRQQFMLDECFERNYSEAKRKKIPIGTYLYSYATDVEEAKREAIGLVNYLKSTGQTEFDLPIFFDIEDKTQVNINKQTQTDMCKAFGEIIKANGFKVGIYSSSYWLLTKIDLAQIPSDYAIWVASFGIDDGNIPGDKYKFPGEHDIWQYTSKGKLDGIEGYVDMNICYKRIF